MEFSTILLTATILVIIGLCCGVTYLVIDNYKEKRGHHGHTH